MPWSARGLGGGQRHRELCDHAAVGVGLVDLLDRGVVMGAERHAVFAGEGYDAAAVGFRHRGIAAGMAPVQHLADLIFAVAGRHHPGLQVRDIGRLPLPGGVIHHRQQFQPRIVDMRLEQAQHLRVGHLAAQVQQVLGPQGAVGLGRVDPADHRAERRLAVKAVLAAMEAERVQHRRDPGRRALAVMGQRGAIGVPERAGPGLVVLFQVVGVDVDQAGDQPVRRPIQGLRRRRPAGVHRHDGPIADNDLATDQAVGGDDGLGIDALFHGLMPRPCTRRR